MSIEEEARAVIGGIYRVMAIDDEAIASLQKNIVLLKEKVELQQKLIDVQRRKIGSLVKERDYLNSVVLEQAAELGHRDK